MPVAPAMGTQSEGPQSRSSTRSLSSETKSERDLRIAIGPDGNIPLHLRSFAEVRSRLESNSADYEAVKANSCVIYRSSCPRVTWDFVMAGLAMYAALAGPMATALNAEHHASGYYLEKTDPLLTTLAYLSLIVDICFLADVVVNFFTSYFREFDEVEVYSVKMIAENYLRSWFLLDLLCCIPLELIFLSSGQSSAINIIVETLQAFSRIVKIFKIIRLTKLFKQGDNTLSLGRLMYMQLSRNQRRILAIFIAVLYISHFLACLWVTEVNLLLSASYTSWSKSYGVENYWVDEYVAALYWVVQTMTTVGYGDVRPENQLERLIATMVMVVSALFWGYIVASMASIISSFSAQSEKAEQFMEQITHYLKEKEYPKQLSLKVQRYYRHYYYKQHATDEVEFIENLSSGLQTEVGNFLLGNLKGKIVTSCSLFGELDRRELSLMTMILKPQFFEAGSCICARATRMQQIFFVLSGDVFVLSPQDATVPVSSIDLSQCFELYGKIDGQHLSPAEIQRSLQATSNLRWNRLDAGNYFGAYEALTLQPARLPVLAASAADLFTISRRDLDSRFRLHPEVLLNVVNRTKSAYTQYLELYRSRDLQVADEMLRSHDGKFALLDVHCLFFAPPARESRLKSQVYIL